jgi:hypothetical protein
MAHRTLAGRPLVHLPALADIARDGHPFVVIQKSAQVGVSELLVNLALWAGDSGYAGRGNVLFLMPTQNQMDDFAQARIDRALQDSPYLRSRLQPEPPRRKGADSKRLKRVGPGYIYLRGADSRRQVATVDADLVILDEFDQMEEGVLELARKRLGSSQRGLLRIASTPRLPESGVNALYLMSDQRRYFLPCRHCGLEQPLTWDENVDLERAAVVCGACRKPMDVRAKGRWIAQTPGNERVRGYHLSRLYSPWANLAEMIEASQATTPFAMQEFRNSDLAEPFVPPGGRLTLDVLDRCRRDYVMPDGCEEKTFMGIDVGIKLHVVIRQPVDEERIRSRAVFIGEVDTVAELSDLVRRYDVEGAIVDALPQQRLALEFAGKESEVRVGLAYYNRTDPGHESVWENGVQVYRINRTQALDEMFHAFQTEAAEIPKNARVLGGRVRDGLGEYYRQMMALSRVLEQNSVGNWVARYVDHGKADHFAHAEAYCAVAIQHCRSRIAVF